MPSAVKKNLDLNINKFTNSSLFKISPEKKIRSFTLDLSNISFRPAYLEKFEKININEEMEEEKSVRGKKPRSVTVIDSPKKGEKSRNFYNPFKPEWFLLRY